MLKLQRREFFEAESQMSICWTHMDDNAFDPDLIRAIFKLVWSRRALEREKNEGADAVDCEVIKQWLLNIPWYYRNRIPDSGWVYNASKTWCWFISLLTLCVGLSITDEYLDKSQQIILSVNNKAMFNYNNVGVGTSKKIRPTSANSNALKLSCELLRAFVAEAVQRAAAIAEAEGVSKIEATHLERILPQLLMDF